MIKVKYIANEPNGSYKRWIRLILNNKLTGSYTIEYALIMPIILAVILLCIYVTIYMHDRAVMDYAVTRTIVGLGQDDTITDDEVVCQIEDELSQGLFGKWENEVEIVRSADTRIIEVNSTMKMPLGLLDSIMGKGIFKVNIIKYGISNRK